MDEPSKSFAPELSPAASRKWIGRLIVAVAVGAAIWNFLASLTSHVVIPALARVLPADPQSPFYLGTGDYNVAAFFAAVLELCFAAIAAALVSAWTSQSPKAVRRKSQEVALPAPPLLAPEPSPAPKRVMTAPPPALTPVAPAPASPTPVTAAQPTTAPQSQAPQRQVSQPQAPPAPGQISKPAQPERPKPAKPKKVYYNLVGEPVESDEDQ
jgi:hypothetical protein